MLLNLRRAVAPSVVVIVLCLAYTFVETGIGQALFPPPGRRLAHRLRVHRRSLSPGPSRSGSSDATTRRIPLASGPTNYGPRSIQLFDQVQTQVAALKKEGITPTNGLVTGSGSGLDPDIAPADAYAQVNAVAKANGLPSPRSTRSCPIRSAPVYFGIFGAPYVNVLLLNEALAKLKS